jgi:hypothetical protein
MGKRFVLSGLDGFVQAFVSVQQPVKHGDMVKRSNEQSAVTQAACLSVYFESKDSIIILQIT